MYLHIGDERLVPSGEIIGVFDLDAVTVTKTGRDFLKSAERRGRVETVSQSIPKSFVLISPPGRWRVVTSPISSATLCRRAAHDAVFYE